MSDASYYDTAATMVDAGNPMAFLLSADFSTGIPQAEQILEGYVIEHLNNRIVIDIGAKSEGLIFGREVETMDSRTREALALGNQVLVYVVDPEDKNGNIILSYTRAVEENDWRQAQALYDTQELYQGKVIGFNKGGVLVRVGQIRGFVPTSQLSPGRHTNPNDLPEEQLRKVVGEMIYAKVIEVDRSRNRLILSERAAAREMREAQRNQLFESLKDGDVREGRVVNIADFGAFVDIGAIEGLVHLSELSWKRLNHPTDKLKIGEQVKVQVLSVDRERQRVALSIKRLESDPWSSIEDLYRPGQLVEACITKITKYGAFASLNEEYAIEGLIHISELADQHVKHPRDVVEKDQVVTARIIRIDREQRQIGLSLKQVASDAYLESDLALVERGEEG